MRDLLAIAVKRVVIVARQLAQGGAERQIVALARALRARGADVHLLLFYPGGVYDAEAVSAGVVLHCLDKTGRWDTIGFLWRFASTMRRLQPAVVYSFLDLPNILAALVWRHAGQPRLIWSIRAAGMEMRHYDWLSRVLPWIEARLSRRADITIANSHAGLAWATARGFPREQLQVIENGIDTRHFSRDTKGRNRLRALWGVPADAWVVGLAARIDPMKDHPGFLRACALQVAAGANLHIVCVGDGEPAYRRETADLANALGLAGRVVWAGARQDMPAVHSAFDIACSASAFGEGFSNAIGEAMACGTPCVVTDVGDSARIVGDLGELAPARDVQALADALARMQQRVQQEPDLGQRARQRIETQFSLERMVSRTEMLLFERQ